MDAGHAGSTTTSVDDCFMRPLGRLVGIIQLLCISNYLQSNQPPIPLSRSNFVVLHKSLSFERVGGFEAVNLVDIGPGGICDQKWQAQ
jgi:hypothetical protein